MSNRREKPVAASGRGRAGRISLAVLLMAGAAACTASPRYPISAGDRAGDGGLTPWQPKYPISSRDAAQDAADRASGQAVPAGTYAPAQRQGQGQAQYPAYAARPVAPPAPPPPTEDDDTPHPMSSAPVDSSDLPPPTPSSAQPRLETETEAEARSVLPPGFVHADYVVQPRAASGLMPGVELAAYHHRKKAEQADDDAAQTTTLKPGESLEAAAKRLGVSLDDLVAANNIKNPRKVRAGTVLKAPGHAAEKAQASSETPKSKKGAHESAGAEKADADSSAQITLKPGESLDAAAKRLGVSRDELMAANDIKNPRKVRAGTVLKAPGHVAEKAEASAEPAPKSKRAGRESTETAKTADADTGASDQITLRKGESLDAAAKRLGVSRKELMAANGIKNPRKVRAGMVLKAPGQAEAQQGSSRHERQQAEEDASADAKSYTVKKGDTLYSLGRRFGKAPGDLAKLNGLRTAQGLRAGQVLQLSEAEHAGRHHGAAAEAETASTETGRGGEIDLPAPDRFTMAAMRKQARGQHLTRRERQAIAKEDAREKAAELASTSSSKHRRGVHANDAASEVAADSAANETLSPSTRARRAREAAEGPATYNPPPPIARPAAPPVSGMATTSGDRDIPPPVTSYGSAPAATAPMTSAPMQSTQSQVATLNGPKTFAPTLGRARPTTPEAAAGGAMSAAEIAAAGKGRFIWPLKGSVLSPFGDSGPGQHNDGLDISAQPGEGVHAAAAGEVVYAGSSIPGFGNLVLVKHPGGWVTAYAHLNRIEVRMRDSVAQGDEIGQAGQTGAVDRPLLHFEVRYAPQPTEKARPVDPALVLPAG